MRGSQSDDTLIDITFLRRIIPFQDFFLCRGQMSVVYLDEILLFNVGV